MILTSITAVLFLSLAANAQQANNSVSYINVNWNQTNYNFSIPTWFNNKWNSTSFNITIPSKLNSTSNWEAFNLTLPNWIGVNWNNTNYNLSLPVELNQFQWISANLSKDIPELEVPSLLKLTSNDTNVNLQVNSLLKLEGNRTDLDLNLTQLGSVHFKRNSTKTSVLSWIDDLESSEVTVDLPSIIKVNANESYFSLQLPPMFKIEVIEADEVRLNFTSWLEVQWNKTNLIATVPGIISLTWSNGNYIPTSFSFFIRSETYTISLPTWLSVDLPNYNLNVTLSTWNSSNFTSPRFEIAPFSDLKLFADPLALCNPAKNLDCSPKYDSKTQVQTNAILWFCRAHCRCQSLECPANSYKLYAEEKIRSPKLVEPKKRAQEEKCYCAKY